MSQPFEKFLILSDFDGTLTGLGGEIPKSNLEAIERFKALGGHFTFATGRLPSVMKKIFPAFKELINAPAIMSNGAILYDAEKDAILKEVFFSGELGRDIMRELLVMYPTADIAAYADSGELQEVPPSEVVGNSFRKIRIFLDSPEKTIACRDYINEKYNDILSCNRSWSNFAEITSKDAQKGSMIPDIKSYVKSKGDVIACCIGDYENDRSMLKLADISFCPQNAVDEIKAISKHILCPCTDGAIAHLISVLEEQYI